MDTCKCLDKCTCKKVENVFLYEYTYAKPVLETTHKQSKCSKKVEESCVLSNETFCMASNLETCDTKNYVDDDCISLISKDSFSSFDSWIDDDILTNEITRAKVLFKKKYESNSK